MLVLWEGFTRDVKSLKFIRFNIVKEFYWDYQLMNNEILTRKMR